MKPREWLKLRSVKWSHTCTPNSSVVKMETFIACETRAYTTCEWVSCMMQEHIQSWDIRLLHRTFQTFLLHAHSCVMCSKDTYLFLLCIRTCLYLVLIPGWTDTHSYFLLIVCPSYLFPTLYSLSSSNGYMYWKGPKSILYAMHMFTWIRTLISRFIHGYPSTHTPVNKSMCTIWNPGCQSSVLKHVYIVKNKLHCK